MLSTLVLAAALLLELVLVVKDEPVLELVDDGLVVLGVLDGVSPPVPTGALGAEAGAVGLVEVLELPDGHRLVGI